MVGIKMLDKLIVIPARYNSSRLPKKILANIHGFPMIYWVAKRIENANLTKYVVAADNEKVFDVCKKYNIPVVMTNPDLKNGTERVFEVSKIFNEYNNFINIQGDEPLINIQVVDDLIGESKSYAFNTAMSKIPAEKPNNVSEVKVALTKENRIVYASRAKIPHFQSESTFRYKIQGVYLYSREILERFVNSEMGPLEQYESVEQLQVY